MPEYFQPSAVSKKSHQYLRKNQKHYKQFLKSFAEYPISKIVMLIETETSNQKYYMALNMVFEP